MCGIAGVVGKNALFKTSLLTLNQLSRGRLGFGLAFTWKGRIRIAKAPIDPTEFLLQNSWIVRHKADVAISHNRQPTRGLPSYENTHPFTDCLRRFALIHNGVAFNEGKTKELLANGHEILGETDSEILTHQLEEYFVEYQKPVTALMRFAKEELHGAILILTREGVIYGVRNGYNPIRYVKWGNEIYIASEAEAIEGLGVRKSAIKELKEQQVLEAMRGRLRVYGKGVERRGKVSKIHVSNEWLKNYYLNYWRV